MSEIPVFLKFGSIEKENPWNVEAANVVGDEQTRSLYFKGGGKLYVYQVCTFPHFYKHAHKLMNLKLTLTRLAPPALQPI